MLNLLYKFNELSVKVKFFIASLIPIIILISMTIVPITTMYKGTEINVLVNAYGSLDSIRGKNLYLKYKFENIDNDKLPDSIKKLNKDSNFKNINAYIVLKKVEEIYDLDYISIEEPKDRIYLKCVISPYYEGDNKINANVKCNLDRFFVSQENFTPLSMEKFEDNQYKWLYIAKIKVYKGYSILTDVKLK